MDAELRREAGRLRKLGSARAADELIASYPRRGRHGVVLVQHISWKPADQMRLARHFLAGQPHAHGSVLEAFASFMSLKNFVQVLEEVWPTLPEDASLFRYNLSGAMRQFEYTEENARIIKALFEQYP